MPFKIYADFESVLKGIRRYEKMLPILKTTKSILCALMINLAGQLFFTEERMEAVSLLKQFLKSMVLQRGVIKTLQ